MKTFKNLTDTERNILLKKASLHYNFGIFDNMYRYITTSITDPEFLDNVLTLFENFLSDLDSRINNHLSSHENDN